jgi:hypothetical protein
MISAPDNRVTAVTKLGIFPAGRPARGSTRTLVTRAAIGIVASFRPIGLQLQQKWSLTFSGDKAVLRGKARNGSEIAVDGESGG